MRSLKLRLFLPVLAVIMAIVNITVASSPVRATAMTRPRPHRPISRPVRRHRNPLDGVPSGIMPQRGHARKGSSPASLTASEMTFHGGTSHGGVMDITPRVYIVYWGSQWGKASSNAKGDYTFSGDPDDMAPYQQEFFKGLGTDGERWSSVMTQYCDQVTSGASTCPATNAFHIAYPSGSTLAGVWYDDSTAVPAVATDSQIEQEAVAAAIHFGNNSPGANSDNQYIITSPTGTDPGSVFQQQDCAWHASTTNLSWSGDDVAYTNMPYIPDQGSTCGQDSVNRTTGTLDGVSIVGGHEYAETLTDPFPATGWFGTGGTSDKRRQMRVGRQ